MPSLVRGILECPWRCPARPSWRADAGCTSGLRRENLYRFVRKPFPSRSPSYDPAAPPGRYAMNRIEVCLRIKRSACSFASSGLLEWALSDAGTTLGQTRDGSDGRGGDSPDQYTMVSACRGRCKAAYRSCRQRALSSLLLKPP